MNTQYDSIALTAGCHGETGPHGNTRPAVKLLTVFLPGSRTPNEREREPAILTWTLWNVTLLGCHGETGPEPTGDLDVRERHDDERQGEQNDEQDQLERGLPLGAPVRPADGQQAGELVRPARVHVEHDEFGHEQATGNRPDRDGRRPRPDDRGAEPERVDDGEVALDGQEGERQHGHRHRNALFNAL